MGVTIDQINIMQPHATPNQIASAAQEGVRRESVSAGAKIRIVPVEKSATPGRSPVGLILETEEGRMCSGGATWKKLLSLNGRD
jgi:hypothetical protein